MNKKVFIGVIMVILAMCVSMARGQSLAVGTVLEDTYRRAQLLGELDSTISFTVLPLYQQELRLKKVSDFDSTLQEAKRSDKQSVKNNLSFQILPLSWQNTFNSHHPYGWNDGAMIPAKGYQSMVSGGFFSKLGPISFQFQPEYVYAQNKNYSALDIYGGAPDLPAKFGNGAYSKLNWGQSSLRLNFGSLSFGLSSENLSWGPGIHNSLLMSNNAPGFKHLTLNTIRPLRTSFGSLEFQIIAGKLEGSGYSYLDHDPRYSDWRYLSSVVFTYHPKWIPGLFLGLTRSFQTYSKDLNKVGDFIPFIRPYQKVNDKNNVSGADAEDQLTSLFARWLFTKSHTEIYLEYGLNDHSYNLRDFIGSPEHSRAYIFGMNKLIPLKSRNDEYMQFSVELTQMSQSIDRILRDAGYWYQHFQILQGYTNKGEVLGAGIGPGGDLQTFDLKWVRGIKSVGLQFERYVHNDDYYESSVQNLNGFSRKWVDLSIALHGNWDYKKLLLNAKLQFIDSLNYQWKLKNYIPDSYYIPENDVFNFHGELGLMYRF
jgi:hypothetical protein